MGLSLRKFTREIIDGFSEEVTYAAIASSFGRMEDQNDNSLYLFNIFIEHLLQPGAFFWLCRIHKQDALSVLEELIYLEKGGSMKTKPND